MSMKIGVLGAGTMGAGIAQVAAQAGHQVVLVDVNDEQLKKAAASYQKVFDRLVEKGQLSPEGKIELLDRISLKNSISHFASCDLIIEAIVEKLEVKHNVFKEMEQVVSEDCILASNTSSLSIASIGSALKKSNRVIGIHFFNPAPLMPLVEIIPAVQTDIKTLNTCKELIAKWKKIGVVCKDTPGFIVNRVARPFYGEALRIYEEGIADFATIDWAMTELGGFKMGPFTLMDYIGSNVNYRVDGSHRARLNLGARRAVEADLAVGRVGVRPAVGGVARDHAPVELHGDEVGSRGRAAEAIGAARRGRGDGAERGLELRGRARFVEAHDARAGASARVGDHVERAVERHVSARDAEHEGVDAERADARELGDDLGHAAAAVGRSVGREHDEASTRRGRATEVVLRGLKRSERGREGRAIRPAHREVRRDHRGRGLHDGHLRRRWNRARVGLGIDHEAHVERRVERGQHRAHR